MTTSAIHAHTAFILCKIEGDGLDWPAFEWADGRHAVAVFTAADKARAFLKTVEGLAEGGCDVHTMEQPDLLRWLRQALLKGAQLVWIDPEPAETEARYMEIFHFLADAEGGQGPVT
jgi:hypothetical protein